MIRAALRRRLARGARVGGASVGGARVGGARLAGWGALALGLLGLCGHLALELVVRAGDYPPALLAPPRAASLTVLDGQGQVLRQRATAAGGRERWLPLQRISPWLVAATLAAEDRRFYDHDGVDYLALLRAVWLDLKARRFAYGGSTLTMQLVRVIEPERRQRTLSRKLAEIVSARRLERALDGAEGGAKRAVLEQYLNRVYYGHGAWGAEAAARTYFGKSAQQLTAGEAALLAVLPRRPRRYDPFRSLRRTLNRRRRVLGLMVSQGTLAEAERQLAERTPLRLRRRRSKLRAPHFVDYVLSQLPARLARGGEGATVRTTLDGPLQREVEVAVRSHLDQIARLGVSQAAVVVLRNRDGAILAMVGSRRYFDAAESGAHNAATARLRPGSTLKPFIYALALERGDTPATIAHDVILLHETHETYTKDVRQHGPARYREALAGSYNLAAVHTLQRVGVATALARLRRAGLSKTLDQPEQRYGPGLAIGEAEVRLLDLAGAFAAFGRAGVPVSPWTIRRVAEPGRVTSAATAPPAVAPRAFSPEVAYLIYDILADPDARRPMFGDRVPLALPYPVALKTGTTRAYTDNWALGTTAELTVGVWAGNFDGSPTFGSMSMQGATPLLRAVFAAAAARFGEPTAPPRPGGVLERSVCALSGLRPGPHCPHRKLERFIASKTPGRRCDWHRLRCGRPETVYPKADRPWLAAQGLLPARARCAGERPRGPLRILSPRQGARYHLDPYRPAAQQLPPLRASRHRDVRWRIDGVPAERWRPVVGQHEVVASAGGQRAQALFEFVD